jgi:hypothetical protein
MATGVTTTGVLSDSLDLIVASARSRREYESVVPQLMDRVDLDANSGISWKEVVFEQLNAQAITETTVLDNAQRYDDSAITITPQMVQIMTAITDKTKRNLSTKSLAQIGKLGGNAMMRKRDEDMLTALDGSTMTLGTANTPLVTGDVAAARYRITSNPTEKGNLPISGVFHGYQIKDFYDELAAGVGTYPIPEGSTAMVFKSGFNLPIANVTIFEDGNIAIDSSDDAKGFVFAKEAWVLVNGMNLRTETERKPGLGGGADLLYMTDEYAAGERSAGNWSAELIGDASQPS